MSIDLSPASLDYVNQQVALGRFVSPAAALEAAIAALRDAELRRDEMRELLETALEESRRGETLPADPERTKSIGRKILSSLKEAK